MFAEVDECDLERLLEEKDSDSTKRIVKRSVKLFRTFLTRRNEDTAFESFSSEKLDGHLKLFFASIRKQSGNTLKAASFQSIKYGLTKYIKETCNVDVIGNLEFHDSMAVYKATLKDLKKRGLGSEHRPAISVEDLRKLYGSNSIFDVNTARGLQFKVWFDLMFYLCHKGRFNLRKMRKTTFAVITDSIGQDYVCYADQLYKEQGCEDTPRQARMYAQQGNKMCPVSSFKKYLSKLNPDLDAFWQRPLQEHEISSHRWYCRAPLGKNTLGNMMAKISRLGKLSQIYTNHSIRATTLSALDSSGIEVREIMCASGLKTARAIKNYSGRLNDPKAREISESLSRTLGLTRTAVTTVNVKERETSSSVIYTLPLLETQSKIEERSQTESDLGVTEQLQNQFGRGVQISSERQHLPESQNITAVCSGVSQDTGEDRNSVLEDNGDDGKTPGTNCSSVLPSTPGSSEDGHSNESQERTPCYLCGFVSVNKPLWGPFGNASHEVGLISKYFGQDLDLTLGPSICPVCEKALNRLSVIDSELQTLEQQLWERIHVATRDGSSRFDKLYAQYLKRKNKALCNQLVVNGKEGYFAYIDKDNVGYTGTPLAEKYLAENAEELTKMENFCRYKFKSSTLVGNVQTAQAKPVGKVSTNRKTKATETPPAAMPTIYISPSGQGITPSPVSLQLQPISQMGVNITRPEGQKIVTVGKLVPQKGISISQPLSQSSANISQSFSVPQNIINFAQSVPQRFVNITQPVPQNNIFSQPFPQNVIKVAQPVPQKVITVAQPVVTKSNNVVKNQQLTNVSSERKKEPKSQKRQHVTSQFETTPKKVRSTDLTNQSSNDLITSSSAVDDNRVTSNDDVQEPVTVKVEPEYDPEYDSQQTNTNGLFTDSTPGGNMYIYSVKNEPVPVMLVGNCSVKSEDE